MHMGTRVDENGNQVPSEVSWGHRKPAGVPYDVELDTGVFASMGAYNDDEKSR